MHDGTTLIVDVETLGVNSYALSLPAEDLWVAYEVVRRHVDANGVRHFSQMVEAKTTSDGYSFKFDTGDTFTCASHLNKPTSSTLSDTSSELPSVSGADEGKVLSVNNSGVWGASEPIGKKFIVTLTPTALDYSGTMDKTVAEINAAYEAGRVIVFRIPSAGTNYDAIVTRITYYGVNTYPVFEAYATMTETFIGFTTAVSQDGTSTAYETEVYELTPAT